MGFLIWPWDPSTYGTGRVGLVKRATSAEIEQHHHLKRGSLSADEPHVNGSPQDEQPVEPEVEQRLRYYEREVWLPPLLTLRWDDLTADQREKAIEAARLHARMRVGAIIHDEGEREAYEPPNYLPKSLPAELGAEEGEMLDVDATYWKQHGETDVRWVTFRAEWKQRVAEAREQGRLP